MKNFFSWKFQIAVSFLGMLLAFYFPKKLHAAEKAGRVTVSQKDLKMFFV